MFLHLFAHQYSARNMGIYEAQFIPLHWFEHNEDKDMVTGRDDMSWPFPFPDKVPIPDSGGSGGSSIKSIANNAVQPTTTSLNYLFLTNDCDITLDNSGFPEQKYLCKGMTENDAKLSDVKRLIVYREPNDGVSSDNSTYIFKLNGSSFSNTFISLTDVNPNTTGVSSDSDPALEPEPESNDDPMFSFKLVEPVQEIKDGEPTDNYVNGLWLIWRGGPATEDQITYENCDEDGTEQPIAPGDVVLNPNGTIPEQTQFDCVYEPEAQPFKPIRTIQNITTGYNLYLTDNETNQNNNGFLFCKEMKGSVNPDYQDDTEYRILLIFDQSGTNKFVLRVETTNEYLKIVLSNDNTDPEVEVSYEKHEIVQGLYLYFSTDPNATTIITPIDTTPEYNTAQILSDHECLDIEEPTQEPESEY